MSKQKRPSHHLNGSATSFQNPWPSAGRPTWAELLKVSFPLGWYSDAPDLPSHVRPVKVVKPDWGAPSLRSLKEQNPKSNHVIATWLGHAGALAEFPPTASQDESVYVLFDPIFSVRAGPTQYTGPSRLRE